MRLWWKRRPVTIDTTLGSLVALAPALMFTHMVFATIRKETEMELTEKDLFYVVRGRSYDARFKRLMIQFAAVLFPSLLAAAVGGTPGMVIAVLWIIGGYGVVGLSLHRQDNAMKLQAAELHRDWVVRASLPLKDKI